MGMTASAAKTAIKNKLAAILPDLLSAASLDDFDDYLDEQPSNTEKAQIGLYVDEETDTTVLHTLSIIIQIQLYKRPDWKQKYHGILMGAIREHITADLIDFITRESIEADLYPVIENTSSFNFYIITFSEPLDDCS